MFLVDLTVGGMRWFDKCFYYVQEVNGSGTIS
jgi:hypothetical protein